MTDQKIPTMLTIPQILERFPALNYNFVRRLCIENKICYVRVGRGRYLINLEKFVDWLNGDEKKNCERPKKEVHEILIDRYKLNIELMKRGVTQNQLAEMCGLSRVTVNYIIRGRSCSGKTGYKIAQALGVKIEDLKQEE
jgi:DNA-binding XRE family transcriptional regulator|uniref:Helix-turn-helix XRE-family like protein n=1 Tax=Myoviridae sp. ct0wg9 TaxID=2826600 RepID=A0A8S5NFF8_9CAUD|nr:MAG TPA: helix-turn-helix XRE-family like protein [Myoviridae sp. ct0wg9]